MLNSMLHEQLTDGTPASLRHVEVPAGSDSEDEEDHSGQQVGDAEQEDEDKEIDEDIIKNADGVDDPLPNTYTPLLPSNSATLATLPASHLATPPGMCAATYTPGNLAINVLSQQLAIPLHGMPEVATSPISHLAISPAACTATSVVGNLATFMVSQRLTTPPSHGFYNTCVSKSCNTPFCTC